jgi:hypothetical protein
MSQEVHNESDKLIAKFMGFEETVPDSFSEMNYRLPDTYREYLLCSHVGGLRFKSSWDWLMPVWFKILDITIKGEIEISDEGLRHKSVFLRGYIWGGTGVGWIMETFYHDCIEYEEGVRESADIKDALYKTVVQFIEWYNENYHGLQS